MVSYSVFYVCRLLSGLVDFDGFYLESDPCLVCNNPEVPYNNNKLSAIKADARFSTTSHMVKLVGSHNISKVTLRVTDVKRQKMVRHSGSHVGCLWSSCCWMCFHLYKRCSTVV